MNVACPECKSVFRVDPSKLPATTVRARCSICGGVIVIGQGASIEEEFASRAPASVASAAPRSAPTMAHGQDATDSWQSRLGSAPSATQVLTPARGAPIQSSESPASRGRTSDAPAAGVAPARTPNEAPHLEAAAPPASQPSSAPSTQSPVVPPAPAPSSKLPQGRPVLFPPRPMMPGGGAASGPARPFASAGQPLNQPLGSGGAQVAPPRSLSQPPPTASISPAPAPNANNAAPPRAPVANPSASGGTVPRAPINPFLANDPHAKAKRLARALVSDLVTYFPQKRDEGLRDGTLKQLFKDEIQKSYEEYTLQVGREFAESTPHFQEALNDILARGQKVF